MSAPQPAAPRDARLKVTDLLDRPGASRQLDLALSVPEGFTLPLVRIREPLQLVGVLESVVDGLLVRGDLHATLDMECARCLQPVEVEVRADVVELFTDPSRLAPDEPEPEQGYEIDEAFIDLEALVRDTLAPTVPGRPLCDAECQGLCATCGADLNEQACSCADEDTDPRWSVLADLDLPDER